MRLSALPSPMRRTAAVTVAAMLTCAQLGVVAWMNHAEHVPEMPAPIKALPIVAPPQPKPPLPLPEPTTQIEMPSLVAPLPEPLAAIEPTAVARLPTLHAPADFGAVLPGLQAGDLGTLGAGALGKKQVSEDRAARPMRRPRPSYPPSARRRRLEGFVDIRMRVDAHGQVQDAVVVKAAPPGVFEEAALDAARRYRFEPAMRDGKAVADTVEQRMLFRSPQ